MMDGRKLPAALGLCALAAPLGAFARQQGKVLRIGVLLSGSGTASRRLVEAFFKGMAEPGYREGRNVHYEVRYGDRSNDNMDPYTRERAGAKVDLVRTTNAASATAVQKATASIPIVFALVADPIISGLGGLIRLLCSSPADWDILPA